MKRTRTAIRVGKKKEITIGTMISYWALCNDTY